MKSDGLKVMLWCRVVLWENSKGWTCGAGTGVVGCCAGLVDGLRGWLVGVWIEGG